MDTAVGVKTKTRKRLKLDPKVGSLTKKADAEAQVIVHIAFTASQQGAELIRIWKSTFLIDQHSSHKSELLHAENITLYPVWLEIPAGKKWVFTLYFSALPKSCTQFDLIEDIPQSGGFHFPNIRRNKSDVYRLKL